MDTLHDLEQNSQMLPRFDDGMLNITEMIRLIAQDLVNEVMDAQADELCGSQNSRNGYRERKLNALVGEIVLKIPKLRQGTYYPKDILSRWSRTDKALIAAVSEMVTKGVSTRKIDKVAAAMGIAKISKSQVSRICSTLDNTVSDLQTRQLADQSYPYIWLDATYIKCRNEGRVSSCALVTCIAASSDGYRRLLGLDAIDTESYEGWKGFLTNLKKRGVEGVTCVISDAHTGLTKAIEEVFPKASWQRCIVHLMRGAQGCANTRQKRGAIRSILKTVFQETDPALVRELYHQAIAIIENICPKAAELLEKAEVSALSYLDFPFEHHRRLRTNNVQERCNRELKRKSRVVQVYPSRKSLIRMMGAVFAEMDEEWQARKWFNIDSIAKATEDIVVGAPKPSYAGSASEHASDILKLALSNLSISVRKVA